MNILFVSAVLPYPLYSGGQVRIYNLLKQLSKKHTITLLSYIRDPKERIHAKEFSFCSSVRTVVRGRARQPKYIARALLGRYPWLLATYDLQEMRDLVREHISSGSYDCIHVEPGYSWPGLGEVSIPVVVSEHNIEWQVYKRYVEHFPVPFLRPLLSLDVKKLRYWSHKIWKASERIVTVSTSDADEVSTVVPKEKVVIVENGVDTDHFEFHKKSIPDGSPVCLFVGDFRWIQNTNAVATLLHTIWPKVRETIPNATLLVVGRDLKGRIRNKALSSPGVTLQEHVRDIRDAYKQAHILLAPISVGGGTKYKILEAMASGTVVVTSPLGIAGLSGASPREFVRAASTDEYVSAVIELSKNVKYYQSLATSARALIEKKYSWSQISEKLHTVWEDVYEKTQ